MQQFEEPETPLAQFRQNSELAVQEPLTQTEQERVDVLFQHLNLVVLERVKNRASVLMGISGGFPVWVLLMFTASFFMHGFPIASFSLMSVLGILVAAIAANISRKKLVKKLVQYDDKRAIGAVIEALTYNDPLTVTTAMTTLTCLLPHLRASDRHLLNRKQRVILNDKLLERGMIMSLISPELALAILTALAQVGDVGSMPAVRKVACGGATGKDPAVRQAARECLPFLQAIAQQEEASQTLLRPSDPAVAPDALVRPATMALEQHEEQVLRGTESMEE